jgi:hypothetical protein
VLASSERPAPLRSRIHRARHVLGELRRLRVKVERAHGIAGTDDERHWCRSAADKLDAVIAAGEALFGGATDPRRMTHRARKRPTLFDR